MFMKELFASLSHLIPQSPTATNYGGRIKRFLQGGIADPFSRYMQWITFCDNAMLSTMFQNPLQAQQHTLHQQVWQQSPYHDYLRKIQFLDTTTYIPDDLLCMGDRMSMAHALELRVPFCDHELVDFSLSLPPKLKMRGNTLKFLLKKVMTGILPEQLLHARKQGFMVPLASWLADDLQKYSRHILEPIKIDSQGIFRGETIQKLITRQARGEYHLTHLVWALLIFHVWKENS
jgi:asparagine synthase (glutamine-hydrolysing)